MIQKTIPDTNPFVRIKVKNSKGEILFYSSDPLEIGKHDLQGLGIYCYIKIDTNKYIIKKLDVTVLSSPFNYKHGTDMDSDYYVGREIPFICDIKITVE